MAVMGLAGVAGSVLAARYFSVEKARRQLGAGWVICAAAAGLTLVARGAAVFYPVALLVGLGTGLTTVTLAAGLRRAVGGNRLGTVIGLGTGLAYAFCNLPVVFEAGATAQAQLALLAAGAGLLAAGALTWQAPDGPPGGYDYSAPGVTAWVLVFLALVFLDSAAFYIIQHTPDLKAATWGGSSRQEVNAGVHLVAALLAGQALDRRWVGGTVLVGAGSLLAACVLLGEGQRALAGGVLLYTAGVSVYSAALVFYPARSLRPKLAALVYAVAGWGGSALGIGVAENRHELPATLLAAAAAVILAGVLLRPWARRASRGT
jgi:hypothetical protein